MLLRTKKDRRLFYTSPIKSLSNQKYRDFKREYGEDNIGIMTGDVTINPGAPIIILTTEVYRNMLYNRADMEDLEYVVFDEIHYFNDIFRGTVWEESLILSPSHIRMIMLSATAPNAGEFANWLRTLRQEKIKVIVDDYRPVPLKHYVFDGAITPVEEARERRKGGKKKKKKKKGFDGRDNGEYDIFNIASDLKDKDFLPALYVIFSKKACEKAARYLAEEDFLLEREEKEEIERAIHDLERTLPATDFQLEQVTIVFNCLRAGVCFHHAGLVPFLKEFIEQLFSKALIKILFVTETFAVGVNMPARTVIFHSLIKFDGMKFRRLSAGEYIQLSGRAGRRGIDTVGHVLAVLNPPLQANEVKGLIAGEPDKLESQFNLTYSSIMNHFASRTEEEILEILKRSFGQYLYQSAAERVFDNKRSRMEKLLTKIDGLTVSCDFGCTTEAVTSYYRLEQKALKWEQKKFHETVTITRDDITRYNRNFKSYFERGRLIQLTDKNTGEKLFAVVIDPVKPGKGKKIVDIRVMTADGRFRTVTLRDVSHGTGLFFPSARSAKWPKRNAIKFIRSAMAELTRDNLVPMTAVTQEIESFLEDKPEFLDFEEKRMKTAWKYREQLSSHLCSRCPSLNEHLADLETALRYQEQIKKLKGEIRDIKLIHSRDFRCKVKVLQQFGYLDRDKYLTDKGRLLANIFDENELMIAESLYSGVFHGLDVDEVAALLGMFVYMSNDDPGIFFPKLHNSRLKKALKRVKGIHATISGIERRERVENKTSQRPSFNQGFMQLVYLWSQGAELQELVDETNMPEGNIISMLRRLVDLLRQIGTATRTSPFDVGFDANWVTDRVLRGHVQVDL